jgi:hypothetical protein
MRGFLSLFRSIEMTIYRRGWFLLSQFFKQRKKKNLLSQLTKRQSTPFEKYPDLNKQQSDVLDLYGTRNYNSIWYNKEGLIALADLLYSK